MYNIDQRQESEGWEKRLVGNVNNKEQIKACICMTMEDTNRKI